MSYWHPFFVRGQKELLCNVIRKNPRRILKQKEAQLKGLGIESRSSSSYSTASKEQEYEESKKNTPSNTPASKQENALPENTEGSGTNVYNYMMQLM